MNSDLPVSSTLHEGTFNSTSLCESYASLAHSIHDNTVCMQEQLCCYTVKKHWDMIPDDTNILITHGPPFKINDYAHGEHLGCEELLGKVFSLSNLKAHAFGDIHEGAGESVQNGVHFANACSVNERHEIINKQGISLTV